MNIAIQTSGCSLNQADSESMAGLLKKAGHSIVADQEYADLVLYNTCTVKDPSQDRFLAHLKKQDKPVVIAGCIPQADKQGLFSEYSQIGTEQLGRVVEIVESAAAGKKIVALEQHKDEHRVQLPKIRVNTYIEIIPICSGCLSNCTYCKTKQARGNLYSYRPMKIEQAARKAIAEGVKEIWLTSQDNGAYGMDIKSNPGELLTRIAHIEGDFMIRFGMTNPDWTKKWLSELIQAYKHPRVYKFLHLPIQSGSDAVLKHMGRRCTAQDIRDIVGAFRKAIPEITIATDIICGYPTETEENFQATLKLVEELKFPIIHISKFYARPDTPAAQLKQLDSQEKKNRSRQLTTLFESEAYQQQHNNYIAKTVDALFLEQKGSSKIGKTKNYIQVIANDENIKQGAWNTILVQETTRDDLRGSLHND